MKKIFYIIALICLSSFSFENVNAEEIYGYDTSNYKYVGKVNRSSQEVFYDLFTNENLVAIDNYFNNFLSGYSSSYKWILTATTKNNGRDLSIINQSNVYFKLFRVLSLGDYFFFSVSSSMPYLSFTTYYVNGCYSFNFNTNEITSITCPNSDSVPLVVYNSGYYSHQNIILWTKEDYYFNSFAKPNSTQSKHFLYYPTNTTFSEKYSEYYDYNIAFEYNAPVFSLMDLVGIHATKDGLKKAPKVKYKINYYFDNSLDFSKTEEFKGDVDDVITNFTDYSNDLYYLDNSFNYSLVLSSNEEENVLNIYYKQYKRTSYKIEYYFDDILKEKYTEIKEELVDTVITDFTDYSSDYWTLVENDYTLTIQENSNLNVLRIDYHSKNYGTEYQTIDTKNSKIPFLFQFSDIKEMFSGVNFDIFKQSEQLAITIFINMWFVAIFTFVSWLFLKIIYKVFQLFR